MVHMKMSRLRGRPVEHEITCKHWTDTQELLSRDKDRQLNDFNSLHSFYQDAHPAATDTALKSTQPSLPNSAKYADKPEILFAILQKRLS